MDYREYAPIPALRRFVDRVWTLAGAAGQGSDAVQPILPDGRPELIVHFGAPFERVSGAGDVVRQARVLIAGQLTEQLLLRPTGTVSVLGVRFHPFGAAAFLPLPQHHLTGLTIAVDAVRSRLAVGLARVCDHTGDVHAAVPLVQAALLACLDATAPDDRIQHAVGVIVGRGGAVSIDEVASGVALSRRHLERRFLAAVGIAPKRLARIARFQRALRALDAGAARATGATTAAACGYADQSHFIREFRALAGCSPSEHLVRQGELTGFFVSG
jgi:AraC-like DNA-binding protein